MATNPLRKVPPGPGRKKKRDKSFEYNLWIGSTACVVLVGCAIALFAPSADLVEALVNDPSLVAHVNRNAQGWKAAESPFFQDWSLGDVRRLSGVKVSNAGVLAECTLPDVTVPRSFDARERWPHCFSGVYDMGNCSSSWAIAAVSSMTDRLCIAQNERLELSVQQLLSCDQKFGKGCNGGALDMVWNYMKEEGLVSSTCFPYKADALPCSFQCNEEPKRLSSACRLSTAEQIRREIFINGPVVAPIVLWNDFLIYRSGIYQETRTATPLVESEREQQLHAVKIIGWGVDSVKSFQKEYWIIENSFGKDWGESGYAKIELNGKILLPELAFAGTPMNSKVAFFNTSETDGRNKQA
ncbi:unnamed protein product [Durusdinium trenchii]|uniref:Peptidase C1A papain C-terminal domain-containing protein n=1 Tax=Durusdinium trenchii TaxID=1381693 RepID=A0ABP0LLK1_9DINO